jgi:membrane protease YdiL (CAAX protease family)
LPQFELSDTVSERNRKIRRSLQFAFFAVALLWYGLSDALAGSAAQGIASRFQQDDLRPLFASLFLIFLLALGYSFFAGISKTSKRGLRAALNLPRRATAGREWALGAAIGWGMAIAAILPMALVGVLHVRLWTDARAFSLLGVHLVTILFATLGVEVALRGFAFQRLIESIGPGWATAVMAILLASVHGINPDSTGISIVVTMIGSVLFSLAWLRTHGLWLGWGMHFAWDASLGLLFGLPVRGVSGLGSVVQTRAVGSTWFTGYDFGVEGALFTAIVLIAGIIVLVRVTGDYAWDYTRPEIISAGYEVNPPPPAAHVAMEQEAVVKEAALVQIQPTTPQSRSIED